MIVTFYSFKGGVGRSMALANIGRWLEMRGLDVVMIDWDLEAPGLESYFVAEATQRQAARSRLGLLDLLTTYKDLYPGLPGSGGATPLGDEDFARMLDDALPPLGTLLLTLPGPKPDGEKSAGRLRLLTAGCRSDARFAAYADAVQSFDWGKFYTDSRGAAYFEWLRHQLLGPAGADIVLIDSRTGVAEMSGICTRQLADVVMVLCASNDQNLDGVAMMAESFLRADVMEARGSRGLDLVMVPARVDISEGRPVDLFEASFTEKLERFTPPVYRRVNTSFTKLRIPYVSAYAFAERLAVGEPEGVKSMQEAYGNLAVHLALLAPGESTVRQQCRNDLAAAFGTMTVAIGSLDAEGAGVEPDVKARLMATGIIVSQLPAIPADAWFQRTAATPQSTTRPESSIVLCMGEESLKDGRIRPLWRLARENGVCLHLIAAPLQRAPPPEGWTRWPQRARLWRSDEDLTDLIAELQRPCQAVSVPFLVPAQTVQSIGREAESAHLKSLLLAPDGAGSTITLLGMKGMGKTSLARSVCNDDDVIDAFDGGILWGAVGSPKEVDATVIAFSRALEAREFKVTNVAEAQRRLASLLQLRSCLLIYDDVVDAAQLETLPRGGASCRTLAILRSSTPRPPLDPARSMEVHWLNEGESLTLLREGFDVDSGPDAHLSSLAERLGGLPLALVLANGILRRQGKPLPAAAKDLVDALDRQGLTALHSTSTHPEANALFGVLQDAARQLGDADRLRLPKLARLPAGDPVSLTEVASAVECGPDEARALVRRLDQLGVVAYDPLRDTTRFHPVVHEFLRSLEIQLDSKTTKSPTASLPTISLTFWEVFWGLVIVVIVAALVLKTGPLK